MLLTSVSYARVHVYEFELFHPLTWFSVGSICLLEPWDYSICSWVAFHCMKMPYISYSLCGWWASYSCFFSGLLSLGTIVFSPLIFSVWISFHIKCVSCIQYINGSCFLIHFPCVSFHYWPEAIYINGYNQHTLVCLCHAILLLLALHLSPSFSCLPCLAILICCCSWSHGHL